MVEEIRKLVDIAKEYDIKTFIFKNKSTKVSIKFSESVSQNGYSFEVSNDVSSSQENVDLNVVNKVEIKSPYVGILKLRDKKGDVISMVGKKVSRGDILCNIEVLGIEHKVESPVEGTISSILLNDGDIVGYGSLIMEIEANG
ncbi:MAG: acetyl-CoA carboxylase biotin carboxyl carrier protein, partial [Brevinematia bacterium]